jgi:NADH-quinone oxidoreductase subunit L
LGDVADHHASHALVMSVSMVAFVLGLLAAFWRYNNETEEPIRVPFIANKFHIDEFYEGTFLRVQAAVAALSSWIDRWVINYGIVRGVSFLGCVGGELTRLVQNGNIRTYVFWFSLGVLLLIFSFTR